MDDHASGFRIQRSDEGNLNEGLDRFENLDITNAYSLWISVYAIITRTSNILHLQMYFCMKTKTLLGESSTLVVNGMHNFAVISRFRRWWVLLSWTLLVTAKML